MYYNWLHFTSYNILKMNEIVDTIFASVFDKHTYYGGGGVAGRVKRELREMIEQNLCDPESISFTCEIDNISKHHFYKLNLRHNLDHRWYEFILSPHYPFRAPKLRLNNRAYETFLCSSVAFNKALDKFTGNKCLCCKSMLCQDNWAPIMLLKQVFAEVQLYHNFCRKVSTHIIVNVVKRKYLIDDINLLEWLY